MSWGSKQTTDTTQNSSQTSMPLQQAYAAQLQSSLAPHYASLVQEANQPVYGDAQKAGVLNNLNDLANASIKHLSSTLAGHGQLDSGQFTQGAQGIEQQRYGQASQFFSQLPAMERQAHMSNMMAALNGANAYASSVPMGQTSSGSSTSDSTQTSTPGLAGLVGAIGGMALSGLTGGLSGGLAGMAGGGGFGAGFNNGAFGTPMPAMGGGGGGYQLPLSGGANSWMMNQNPFGGY